MPSQEIRYAFIDSQNLNLAILNNLRAKLEHKKQGPIA